MTSHTANGSGGSHTISESEIVDGAFLAALGMRLTEISGTRVRGEIELGPDHHTPWGVVHGGVYTTAVESVASVGASAAVLDRGQVAVGVANNTDFLRPLTGGTVEVLAEPIQQGRTQQLWQVIITSTETGMPVARGQLRLANVAAAGLPRTVTREP